MQRLTSEYASTLRNPLCLLLAMVATVFSGCDPSSDSKPEASAAPKTEANRSRIPGLVITLDYENFIPLTLESKGTVLVEFMASSSRACQSMEPILKEISLEHGREVLVAKVSVDMFPELGERYLLGGVPTFVVFRDGEVVHQTLGQKSKDDLVSLIFDSDATTESTEQTGESGDSDPRESTDNPAPDQPATPGGSDGSEDSADNHGSGGSDD